MDKNSHILRYQPGHEPRLKARDTIFALSSGAGRAGVAVIRVSGPATGEALEQIAGRLPRERVAALRNFRAPGTGEIIDRGLALWFPRPRSFSGEDMAELHVHGGPAVIDAMLAALAALGLRPSEPGEFTRRAFENGKLDLSEAEGLADLVNAETEAQRRLAVHQSGGALRAQYEEWRATLIEAMALIESGLDFSDEADVPAEALALARPKVAALIGSLERALADGRRGEIVREGVRVAIIGAPNAGKSSLLNALVRREAAIVSDEPGTTRDVIEVRLDLEGYPFTLSDTAGLREAAGPVEQEGIRRAVARAEEADLVLHLRDVTAPPSLPPPEIAVEKLIPVWTKIDLARPPAGDDGALAISVRTGEGLAELQARLLDRAKELFGLGEPALITRARHRMEIEAALSALRAFYDHPEKEAELLAEDLRIAATALGRLTGRVDVEDVLDRLFADFCIGK